VFKNFFIMFSLKNACCMFSEIISPEVVLQNVFA